MTRLFAAAALAALLAPAAASAQDAGGSSDVCTDRPTKSSNACTVDAGHFQYETDLYDGVFERHHGVTTDTSLITNPTLKYGVSSNVDVEVNIAPYEVVRTRDASGAGTLGGVGDLYLRAKYDALGGATGKVQVGFIGSLKAPTAREGIGNGAVEGGLAVPLAYKFTDTLILQLTPEADALLDQDGHGRHAYTQQTISLVYALPHDVSLYGELAANWDFDPAGTTHEYFADVAVSWLVTRRFQLDAGANIGLNADAPGAEVYVGASQKF